MRTPEDIAGLLKSHGVMPTQQRMIIARILFNRDQHLSADQVESLIELGADDITDPFNTGESLIGPDTVTGYGQINISSSFQLKRTGCAWTLFR